MSWLRWELSDLKLKNSLILKNSDLFQIKIMETTRLADPQYIGPGVWYDMHTIAANSQSLEHALYFIWYIKTIARTFKCLDCRQHFQQLVQDEPPEKWINEFDDLGRRIGPLKWTHMAHNRVRKFQKKKLPSFEEVFNFYYHADEGLCFGDCQAGQPNEINQKSPDLRSLLFQSSLPRPELAASLNNLKQDDSEPADFPHHFINSAYSSPNFRQTGHNQPTKRFRLVGRS